MAFVPAAEALHLALPATTAALILANLAFSIYALRRGAGPGRLLIVTALQLVLFTALFRQAAAHLGAEHFRLDRPARSGDWLLFSLAHALRASDVLDVVEAYGLKIQTVRHQGRLLATLLVAYHLVVNLFVLRLVWTALGSVKRWLMASPTRANAAWVALWIAFAIGLVAWLASVLWVRPWRPVDIPLWTAENVVRVLDSVDAMDSYDVHWHQVPKEWWESTLTVLVRAWLALAIAMALGKRAEKVGGQAGGASVGPAFDQAWKGITVAAVFPCLFVAVSHFVASDPDDLCQRYAEAVGEDDPSRAAAALAALRRMGPAADPAVGPLTDVWGRVGEDRRRAITETLGYLGPAAAGPLEAFAGSMAEAEAVTAVAGLVRVGPSAAPALVRVWNGAPLEVARARAADGLRGFGSEAVPALAAGVTRDNSADYYHWFQELERNWTLRGSSNPTFRAVVRFHREVLAGPRPARLAAQSDVSVEAGAVAVPALTQALKEPEEFLWGGGNTTHTKAAEKLGRIGPAAADAVPALILTGNDLQPYLKEVAIEAVVAIGPKAVPVLTATLADKGHRGRVRAADLLGRLGPAAAEAVPTLAVALADDDEHLRRAAAVTLGRLGPAAREAIPALAITLADGLSGVGPAAAEALHRVDPAWGQSAGAGRAAPALAKALRCNTHGVPARARKGLREIGPRGVPYLIFALFHNDAEGRAGAALALGELGPEAAGAIRALEIALADEDSIVRSTAAWALARVGSAAVPSR